MKRLAAFLKATTIGGLFVVLPLVLVFLLLTKAVLAVRNVAQSVVEKMAGQESGAAHFPILYSLLILLLISFGFGLATSSQLGRAAGGWIEGRILLRVPGYVAVRAIVGGLANRTGDDGIKAGLLTIDPGIECFVFVIEDHGDGHLTVYVPGSPNPGSGNVHIVRKDLVRMLHVRITNLASALQQWGVGSAKVLAKDNVAAASRST
jgi:uncharacterized membrane protein